MITITKIIPQPDNQLLIYFNDGATKQLDFNRIFQNKKNNMQEQVLQQFSTVKIDEGGHSFSWQNGYDCCAEWARFFQL